MKTFHKYLTIILILKVVSCWRFDPVYLKERKSEGQSSRSDKNADNEIVPAEEYYEALKKAPSAIKDESLYKIEDYSDTGPSYDKKWKQKSYDNNLSPNLSFDQKWKGTVPNHEQKWQGFSRRSMKYEKRPHYRINESPSNSSTKDNNNMNVIKFQLKIRYGKREEAIRDVRPVDDKIEPNSNNTATSNGTRRSDFRIKVPANDEFFRRVPVYKSLTFDDDADTDNENDIDDDDDDDDDDDFINGRRDGGMSNLDSVIDFIEIDIKSKDDKQHSLFEPENSTDRRSMIALSDNGGSSIFQYVELDGDDGTSTKRRSIPIFEDTFRETRRTMMQRTNDDDDEDGDNENEDDDYGYDYDRNTLVRNDNRRAASFGSVDVFEDDRPYFDREDEQVQYRQLLSDDENNGYDDDEDDDEDMFVRPHDLNHGETFRRMRTDAAKLSRRTLPLPAFHKSDEVVLRNLADQNDRDDHDETDNSSEFEDEDYAEEDNGRRVLSDADDDSDESNEEPLFRSIDANMYPNAARTRSTRARRAIKRSRKSAKRIGQGRKLHRLPYSKRRYGNLKRKPARRSKGKFNSPNPRFSPDLYPPPQNEFYSPYPRNVSNSQKRTDKYGRMLAQLIRGVTLTYVEVSANSAEDAARRYDTEAHTAYNLNVFTKTLSKILADLYGTVVQVSDFSNDATAPLKPTDAPPTRRYVFNRAILKM